MMNMAYSEKDLDKCLRRTDHCKVIVISAVMTDNDEKAVSAVIVVLRMFVFVYVRNLQVTV